MTMQQPDPGRQARVRSLWSRATGGRSIYSLIFGNNLADKNVAATIISILLVLTLCYLAITTQEHGIISSLANLVFVVVGYYFGSKRAKADEAEED